MADEPRVRIQPSEAAHLKAARCPYCHDLVDMDLAPFRCRECAAVLHPACQQEAGACPCCHTPDPILNATWRAEQPPRRRRRDLQEEADNGLRVAAALCSLFLPGLGQLIQGRFGAAALQFLLFVALMPFCIGAVVWPYSIYDAATWRRRR